MRVLLIKTKNLNRHKYHENPVFLMKFGSLYFAKCFPVKTCRFFCLKKYSTLNYVKINSLYVFAFDNPIGLYCS